MVTFTVSGVWHGAGYTYPAWGFLNGIYIVLARFIKPVKDKFLKITHLDKAPWLTRPLAILFTFALISFSWIFFRAESFTDAFYVITHMFGPTSMDFGDSLSTLRVWVAIGSVVILLGIEAIMAYGKPVRELFFKAPHLCRVALYGLLTAIIVVFGAYGNNQFIYFQF
jgi:hypothetical protein